VMIATQIRLSRPGEMEIRWDDGHESTIRLETLRSNCPCAGCQGETVLLRSYPPAPQPDLPGKNELVDAKPVGHYALQLVWGDGHDTGLYTWEILRALCECPVCREQRSRVQ